MAKKDGRILIEADLNVREHARSVKDDIFGAVIVAARLPCHFCVL
jgi:hypothetical protein